MSVCYLHWPLLHTPVLQDQNVMCGREKFLKASKGQVSHNDDLNILNITGNVLQEVVSTPFDSQLHAVIMIYFEDVQVAAIILCNPIAYAFLHSITHLSCISG